MNVFTKGLQMTDEEKAEEYAIKITDELRNKGFLTNEEIDQRYAGIVQGVLYGLAEGKPKWHDLRKNPNDLPKETGHYLTDDGEYIYDADRKKWRTLTCMACWDFHWLDDEDVIAWTELPKFEEE